MAIAHEPAATRGGSPESTDGLKDLLAQAIGPGCHELRSPLAVVYGFAKMLERNQDLDEHARTYVENIVTSAQRLDELLDALSKLGRIAAERLHPSYESVPLQGVIDDLASRSSNRSRVVVDPTGDVNVKADEAWLSETCHSVVDAICFEEGMEIRISWTIEPHDVTIHFIPGSSFPLVDTEPGKAGLQLALARMRAVCMGGSLEGQGDRVALTLPRG